MTNPQSDVAGGVERVEEVLRVLRAAREMITDPERWCQGAMRIGPRACALGALAEVEFKRDPMAGDPYMHLRAAMHGDVGNFNDTHTHPEVLAAFDRAIELASPSPSGIEETEK